MNFQEYYNIWEAKQRLDPKCWTGYRKKGTKMKGGKRVNNCVKEEVLHEALISSFADLPPAAPHGFWVMKDGKIAVVSRMFAHDEVLQQLFPDIYGGLQGTKLLDLAMKNGLVRAAKFKPFGKDKYSYEGSYHPMYVSSTAKKTLKDTAGHYKMGVKDDFAHYSHKPDTQPATQPTTQPATQPATQPDTQPPVLGL